MIDCDREEACAPAPLPAPLPELVAGYAWARDTIGESGGAVYRLHGKPGAPDLFLKHGTGAVADDVTEEMARLHWLAAYVPVPRLVHFVRSPDAAWLLTTRLPGRTAFQCLAAEPDARGAIVAALAGFLRLIHAIPTRDCPFNSDAAVRMTRARARIDAGLVETEDFDDARAGWSAEQVWDELATLLPLSSDRVVTHGDFSLDNILIDHGVVTGCIDLGRVGVADRYQDLAILWNCLGEFDPTLQALLFDAYALAGFDPAKLHFHLLLDELF